MKQTIALIRMELVRMFTSRRWLAGLLIWGVVGKLAADEVGSHVRNVGLGGWTIFDVHAALVNNMFFVGFLLLTTFVLIACDGLARDRETRFAHIVMVRAGSRWEWWVSKALPMALAAVVFQAGALGVTLAAAVYEGGTISRAPSAFALGEVNESADVASQLFFTPVQPGTDMLVREIGTSLYLSLGFAAIGMAVLALTVRFPASWLPGLVTVGVVLGDRILGWFIHASWYAWVSPSLRLMEAAHSAAVVHDPLPLWSSLVWWTVLLAGSTIAGLRMLRRVDV
ncbi:MAG: hypothetical protein JW733_04740 [Coriobacteriia bacterium]|nr:hypothetical protein [Coriobacteriia bacterium]MBN2847428.1 hypothetical protein [Coriobacteriia bacterium]